MFIARSPLVNTNVLIINKNKVVKKEEDKKLEVEKADVGGDQNQDNKKIGVNEKHQKLMVKQVNFAQQIKTKEDKLKLEKESQENQFLSTDPDKPMLRIGFNLSLKGFFEDLTAKEIQEAKPDIWMPEYNDCRESKIQVFRHAQTNFNLLHDALMKSLLSKKISKLNWMFKFHAMQKNRGKDIVNAPINEKGIGIIYFCLQYINNNRTGQSSS